MKSIKEILSSIGTNPTSKSLKYLQIGRGELNVTDLETYVTIKDDVFDNHVGDVRLVDAKQFVGLFAKSFEGLNYLHHNWSYKQVTLEQPTEELHYPTVHSVCSIYNEIESVKEWFTVPSKSFINALQGVEKFMAKKDVRLYLNGLNMMLDGNKSMSIVGSDGHRLLMRDCEVTSNFHANVIIPRTAVKLLAGVKPTSDVKVTLGEFEGDYILIRFEFDNYVVTTKLIDHRYPDFRKVFEQPFRSGVIKDVKLCLKQLKSISYLVTSKFKGIKLWFLPEGTRVTNESDVELCFLPIIVDHNAPFVALNYEYLISVFANLKDSATIKVAHDASSIVVSDNETTIVQMSMRL